MWVHPGVFAKSAQMIEKIEDQLSRAAKSDGKNKERKLLGNQGTPTPQCNLYEYQTKEVVGEAVCMM